MKEITERFWWGFLAGGLIFNGLAHALSALGLMQPPFIKWSTLANWAIAIVSWILGVLIILRKAKPEKR